MGALINFTLDPPTSEIMKEQHSFVALTIGFNFWIPLWRDVLLALGMRSVSRQSIEHILTTSTSSPVIMLGGAREAALIKHRHPHLILSDRKGVFKLALQHKVPLVPVFTFGELETFDEPKLVGFLSLFKRITGIMPMAFWPPMPHRTPLNTYIGEPVDPNAYTSWEDLREAFKSSLLNLYNEHYQKYNYAPILVQ